MYSYTAKGGTVFNFNAGFCGDVFVVVPATRVEQLPQCGPGGQHARMVVPAADLLEFVAYCCVAPQRISAIENASPCKLLGIQAPPASALTVEQKETPLSEEEPKEVIG